MNIFPERLTEILQINLTKNTSILKAIYNMWTACCNGKAHKLLTNRQHVQVVNNTQRHTHYQ